MKRGEIRHSRNPRVEKVRYADGASERVRPGSA
jgi:hypothetical protein